MSGRYSAAQKKVMIHVLRHYNYRGGKRQAFEIIKSLGITKVSGRPLEYEDVANFALRYGIKIDGSKKEAVAIDTVPLVQELSR